MYCVMLPGSVVDNIFSQLVEEAVVVCKNPETSSIIEHLVDVASCANIRSLMDVFAADWTSVCMDKCASHVVQKMLMVSPKFIAPSASKFDLENVSEDSNEDNVMLTIINFTDQICECLEDWLKDMHGSHVLRALIQLLAGSCVGEKVLKSKQSRNYGKTHNSGKLQYTVIKRTTKTLLCLIIVFNNIFYMLMQVATCTFIKLCINTCYQYKYTCKN